MVNIFSSNESKQIASAISLAEQSTNAEIAAVVIPRSDHYIPELMFYGFILGSIIGFILWEATWAHRFPVFFLIQLLCIFILPFTPGIKQLLLYFLPKKLLFHRAAHLGAEELLAISQQLPPHTPIILLFISLAEHYVHVFPNPIVSHKIEDKNWDTVVNQFTLILKKQNLTKACVDTIGEIGGMLTPIFPDDKGQNLYADAVTHRTKK